MVKRNIMPSPTIESEDEDVEEGEEEDELNVARLSARNLPTGS